MNFKVTYYYNGYSTLITDGNILFEEYDRLYFDKIVSQYLNFLKYNNIEYSIEYSTVGG
jgi:hypothetical protein